MQSVGHLHLMIIPFQGAKKTKEAAEPAKRQAKAKAVGRRLAVGLLFCFWQRRSCNG